MFTDGAWHLIYTKPRQEVTALSNLERQDYRVYLPMTKSNKRRCGRYQVVTEPLFPRYLFIHLNEQDDQWAPLRSTRGVASLVRFGMEPARVSDEFIAALRIKVGMCDDTVLEKPLFTKGERVLIAEGPFSGYDAIFQMEKGVDRAAVMLDFANHYTISVDKHALKKAS